MATTMAFNPGRIQQPIMLPGMAKARNPSEHDDPQEMDVDVAISAVEGDDPCLTELNLNNHCRVDAGIIDQLIEAMVENTSLVKLQLSNVRFSDDHAQALAKKVLSRNTTLKVLNLESNRITPKGIKAIMKALAENRETVLKELRLVNQYYAGGARAEAEIAKYLEKNKTIVKLGYIFKVPSYRTKVDQFVMRNTDEARKKRASITV